MFSLSVPMQYIFIGLQTPEVPKPLDPRMPMFYTNYAYGRLFWVLFFFSYYLYCFFPLQQQSFGQQ